MGIRKEEKEEGGRKRRMIIRKGMKEGGKEREEGRD